MGAYTWTFVRTDKLSREQTDFLMDRIGHYQPWYCHPSKKFKTVLKEWYEMHEEGRDYYINDCGLSPESLTKENLRKELISKRRAYFFFKRCCNKVIDGEMTFDEMFKKIRKKNSLRGAFLTICKNDHFYVHIGKEIFRNFEFYDGEFTTVDAMVEHLRNIDNPKIQDFDDETLSFGPLTDILETKIRNYYNLIGDENFIVHFG